MSEGDDHARARGWEEHRRAELDGVLKTTPAERLRWLEQAIEFAFRAGALPRRPQADATGLDREA
jgi:hypothetical protein